MREHLPSARSLILLAATVVTLSGCLGDNCRPSRGWDNGGRHHHDCDRDRDRHNH